MSLVATLVFGLTLQKSSMLAALVLLLYDHALCFGDEITQIWNVRQNVVTISFLTARYITPIFLFLANLTLYPVWTDESCHIFNLLRLTTVTVIVTNFSLNAYHKIVGAHIVMALRVYALYGAKLIILIGLLVVLLIEPLIMTITITILANYSEPPPNPLKICPYTNHLTKTSALFWASPLFGDTFIFVLTLLKARRYSNRSDSIPMLRLLMRDGAFYYAAVFVAHMFTLLMILACTPARLRSPSLTRYFLSFTQAISTILACRSVLNLRKQPSRSLLRHLSNDHSSTVEVPETSRMGRAIFTSIAAGVVTFFDAPNRTWTSSHSGDDTENELEMEIID
ncbi:hypothetical protein K439DRAFT_1663774 [Ramaria rubella]|nr:hypothetical protein K439DRAFT_1663774 [Ramaria rubella]